MELVALGKALDGRHLGAFALHGQDGAGLDRLAVDMNRAGAALGGVAAHMGAREAQVLAQIFDEKRAGFDGNARGLAVHRHGYLGHVSPR